MKFTMPVKVLDGGISYHPGSIAFQRGPQVLVFDKKLNLSLPAVFSVSSNIYQSFGNEHLD